MRDASVGCGALLVLAAAAAAAAPFEDPPAVTAAALLDAGQIRGRDYVVVEPVATDGLNRQYVIDSRYGRLRAYGHEALAARLGEVAALRQAAAITSVDVIARAVGRRLRSDADTVVDVASHPIDTVIGIPHGVAHLFGGYAAQAKELSVRASAAPTAASPELADTAASARRYAERYFGISANERAWFKRFAVDPYTDNEVLRRTVRHLATVDATTAFGLKFVAVPGLPYAGDVRRAMDAIYQEDPAVLRQRRRARLVTLGLTAAEIDRFDNTLLLSPTRQARLEEAVQALAPATGRADLVRGAMELTNDEEVLAYLQSVALLVRVHAERPLARIVPAPRLPAAAREDGSIVVAAAFDGIYWTERVARDAAALRAALPAAARAELCVSGEVSPSAEVALLALGWTLVRNGAAAP